MNKFSTTLFSTIAASSLVLSSLPLTASARDAVLNDNAQPVVIQGEDISFEYISTVYNGKEQKPAVTIKSGDTTLVRDTDFTVTYPNDCASAGKKTVKIKCIGKYSGHFSATYMIEPLDCSEANTAVNVDIKIADCFYTGMPLTPDVSVTVNGTALESGDYSLAFSDNLNATDEEKAKCVITFRGNFSGSRTADFSIAKTPSKDLDIQLAVHNGDRVVYDLTPLKPKDAELGAVEFYLWDFVPEHYPKIAFNELSFTVPDDQKGGTAVVIPVVGAPNREDYSIVFYPTVTDKIIPKAVMRPIEREYNGEPISVDEITQSGSYIAADGSIISGTWEFWDEPPVLACEKQPCIVTFTPDDPKYAVIDCVVYVTISRKKADEFTLKTSRSEISPFQNGQFVISGIPEDYRGTVSVKCDNSDDKDLKINEVFCKDPTRREYEVEFPIKDGQYTLTAELSGDSVYLPASSKCGITVGDYVPPEEKPSDKVTTPEELAALIESAAEGGTVKAEGIRSIPQSSVKAARDKKLTLEVKRNNSFTWVIDTSKLSSVGTLDLDISTAVIPASLIDKIGGVNLYSFNAYAVGLGNGAEIKVSAANNRNKFANLFLYDTTGELKFVFCARILSDGTARLDIKKSGKYAVIVDSETKLQGDINNDCRLDVQDILGVIDLFLNSSSDTDISKYDPNGDKRLDVTDILALIDIYLNS